MAEPGRPASFEPERVLGLEAVDLSKEKKRRFHQGPRVTTLNFEAGYMLAVLPENAQNSGPCKVGRVHICTLFPPRYSLHS